MPDLDPEIWDNPTLGQAANNERLDRLEKQHHEDRAARLEDREPRPVVVDNDYPGWTPEVQERTGTVPSNAVVVHFADENPNDVVQTGENVKPEGMEDSEWNPDTVADEDSENRDEGSEETEFVQNESSEAPVEPAYSETGSPESNSTEEGNSTKWT